MCHDMKMFEIADLSQPAASGKRRGASSVYLDMGLPSGWGSTTQHTRGPVPPTHPPPTQDGDPCPQVRVSGGGGGGGGRGDRIPGTTTPDSSFKVFAFP